MSWLVTGGAGYIGAHVVREFRETGLGAVVLDDLSSGHREFVDPDTPFVEGSVVDYKESLMGAGFEVNNPNVVAACGCGSSFRVADEDPSCGAPA